MILEKEELLDKVFKSVVMNIMSVEKSILSEEVWLDVGGHYYCVDGVRDILLEREGESLWTDPKKLDLKTTLRRSVFSWQNIVQKLRWKWLEHT